MPRTGPDSADDRGVGRDGGDVDSHDGQRRQQGICEVSWGDFSKCNSRESAAQTRGTMGCAGRAALAEFAACAGNTTCEAAIQCLGTCVENDSACDDPCALAIVNELLGDGVRSSSFADPVRRCTLTHGCMDGHRLPDRSRQGRHPGPMHRPLGSRSRDRIDTEIVRNGGVAPRLQHQRVDRQGCGAFAFAATEARRGGADPAVGPGREIGPGQNEKSLCFQRLSWCAH